VAVLDDCAIDGTERAVVLDTETCFPYLSSIASYTLICVGGIDNIIKQSPLHPSARGTPLCMHCEC
jgi:hypothetical protein